MATWVTHLMIADAVLKELPQVNRRGFCIGSIAPDCNIENEDWTAFTPPREMTHFMGEGRKKAADAERYYEQYVQKRMDSIDQGEELSFLLGYYAHLIADAEFQAMIRDEERIKAMWRRIREDESLMRRAKGMEETWDSAKQLFSKAERFREREGIEADYLQAHPDSGYRSEVLALESFPDYLDFLPGCYIVRKVDVMGDVPRKDARSPEPICMSRKEYEDYVNGTAAWIVRKLREKQIV